MNEQFAQLGDVELCYETFGDPGDPALLLIMGLATQMIGWHDELCQMLADRGFHVIRYDNRDIGRSTHFDSVPPPRRRELITGRIRHQAYTLGDMADDAVRLLDRLGVAAAHVVGASMGGMLAQLVAARHPDRCLSLVSIMSSTGSRRSGQPDPRVTPMLLRNRTTDPKEHEEGVVALFRMVGSPGFERDEDALREMIRLSLSRGDDGAGTSRQLGAIIAWGSRVKDLKRISAPTLVIHGTADRLVRPSGGKATARAVAGAELMLIDGMGHDLPRGVWPRIADAVAANAARAGQPQLAALR